MDKTNDYDVTCVSGLFATRSVLSTADDDVVLDWIEFQQTSLAPALFGSSRFVLFHTRGDYPRGEIVDETASVLSLWPELKELVSRTRLADRDPRLN